MIAQSRAGAARASPVQQFARQIQAIDIKARFGEEVRVSSLPARNVEDARARWQSEEIDEPCNFPAVALEREHGLVLAKILLVEITSPPGRCVRPGTGGPVLFGTVRR